MDQGIWIKRIEKIAVRAFKIDWSYAYAFTTFR